MPARFEITSWHDSTSVLINGRRTITEEVKTEVPFLREYLRTEIRGLLMTPEFMDALPGYLFNVRPESLS